MKGQDLVEWPYGSNPLYWKIRNEAGLTVASVCEQRTVEMSRLGWVKQGALGVEDS